MERTSEPIGQLLISRIDAGDFPSAVYLVGERGKVRFEAAVGNAVVEPEPVAARIDTIYDLASVTKVFVTTLILARLFEAGRLRPSDTVAAHFREFATDDKRRITLSDLLTHTSGMRAWLPLYLIADEKPKMTVESRSEIARLISEVPLGCEPRTKVVYSDLNFLMLTLLIERIFGTTIDRVAEDEIFRPLDLKETFYNPPAGLRGRIAASERGNGYERNACIELGFEISGEKAGFFREDVIRGEVHDGNCHFLGGVSGHAGLFSTAREAFVIARQFLPGEGVLLKAETCRMFRENLTAGLNEARSIGFQMAATPDSTASKALSDESYGHLGFTGTSVWIDPVSERIYILLTNRTHARALPFVIINSTRRRFHELAAGEVSGER